LACMRDVLTWLVSMQGCSTLCGIWGESRVQQALAERRQKPENRVPRSAEL
jgi:hypothetical protein